MRVAEDLVRVGGGTRLRVDLHGVSTFGPGDSRTLIRWEWISAIEPSGNGVVVRSAQTELTFPSGAFGRQPEELAHLLMQGKSITARADVIAQLGAAR